MLFVESGGDNLAANYSRELADYIIYVIDVSGGDKIPRKGGPGISQSDLLVINKVSPIHFFLFPNSSLMWLIKDYPVISDRSCSFCQRWFIHYGEGR